MNQKEFDTVLENVLQDTGNTLSGKAAEYARVDRLSNFKAVGQLLHCVPERALWGFVTKHIIALTDFIEKLDNGDCSVSEEQWKEKTHDIIAYMILLWALIEERSTNVEAWENDGPDTPVINEDEKGHKE